MSSIGVCAFNVSSDGWEVGVRSKIVAVSFFNFNIYTYIALFFVESEIYFNIL